MLQLGVGQAALSGIGVLKHIEILNEPNGKSTSDLPFACDCNGFHLDRLRHDYRVVARSGGVYEAV